MLTVVSPAKTLDYQTRLPTGQCSQILFPEAAAELVDVLRTYNTDGLRGLMGISDKLAETNAERFSRWQWPAPAGAERPAVFAFKGDVYAGLDAYSLDARGLEYLQGHLRILSGLYGLLRPLDGMQAYRLEMGTRLPLGPAANLYEFWGDRLAQALRTEPEAADGYLINLASQEYFRALAPYLSNWRVITPVFKDFSKGQYKVISFYAKKARGMMVRYMAEERPQSPEALKAFNLGGYRFSSTQSEGDTWVFLRAPE